MSIFLHRSSQRKSKQSLKLHYFHRNIIILLYLSVFSLHITVSIQLPLQIGFRFWRHNNLLCCELNTTTQQYSHTEPHDTTIGCVVRFCVEVVVLWLHNTTTCCVVTMLSSATQRIVVSLCCGLLCRKIGTYGPPQYYNCAILYTMSVKKRPPP